MAANQRVDALTRHLVPPAAAPPAAPLSGIQMNPTAAAFSKDAGQSVVLPEHLADPESWHVHRFHIQPDKLVARFITAPHIGTLYENLNDSIAKWPKMKCMGMRPWNPPAAPGPYAWQSYEEIGTARMEVASGLVAMGIGPGQFVGLYSSNCTEWLLVEAACFSQSMITVPLYDTLGADAVEYISNHADVSCVACSVKELPMVLQILDRCPTIKLVVAYPHSGRPMPTNLPAAPPGCGVKVMAIDALRAAGRSAPAAPVPPTPSTMATICYTSGTTGNPKGVVLTHGNIIANAAGMEATTHANTDEPPTAGDVHISYLPLAHIYERVVFTANIHYGCAMGFFRGDPLLLVEDIQELKPTMFCSVPRLWNRIYDSIMTAVNGGSAIQRGLFHMAFDAKKAALMAGRDPPWIWEKLVFSKLKARLGGNLRIMSSGASPISPDVMDFLRVCFCPIIEGYGMTEAACSITMTHPDDMMTGHVGAPIAAIEIKLADVPEMGYTRADKPYPRGEVCVRGPSVFQGYYKDEVQTRETIDEDGWLHTGDIGAWIQEGRLKIIDRKKNIFKLQQGEYISPEKIENVYVRCPLVAQSFVYGDSLTSCLVAIVVPDPETLVAYAKQHGLKGDIVALCKDPKVTDKVLAQMTQVGKTSKLQGFEMVKAIRLHPEPFSVDNGFMTPTFKIKRPQLRQHFQGDIDSMYKALGQK